MSQLVLGVRMSAPRSGCPIDLTLEALGDRWSRKVLGIEATVAALSDRGCVVLRGFGGRIWIAKEPKDPLRL
jgi:hypothetical protein